MFRPELGGKGLQPVAAAGGQDEPKTQPGIAAGKLPPDAGGRAGDPDSFGACGAFSETDAGKELSMLRVNVLAMHRLFKFTLRKMEAQGFGTILNVASSAGLLPGGPYMAGYYASKAYVVSLTRGVAEELREQHSPVYVCALCPGPVDTEFNDRADVVFALKGITPELCVEEAMRGMLRRKTIIVPSTLMRLATTAQKLVPTPLLMPILAHQQKKKLG